MVAVSLAEPEAALTVTVCDASQSAVVKVSAAWLNVTDGLSEDGDTVTVAPAPGSVSSFTVYVPLATCTTLRLVRDRLTTVPSLSTMMTVAEVVESEYTASGSVPNSASRTRCLRPACRPLR